MSADIRDADGIQNYAAIIIRLDNPNFEVYSRGVY